MKKGVLALVGGLIGAMLTPIGARAAVDTDVSDAIRYEVDDSLGEYVDSLEGDDDEEEVIGLGWTFNAFGEPANALCVSTNGTVAPIFLNDDQMGAWGGIGDDSTDLAPDDEDSGQADNFVDCEAYDDDMQEASIEDEIDYFSPLGSDVLYDWEGEDDCDGCVGGAIYWNETEIDSKDAVIVTWDEVSMFSTLNSDYEGYVDGAGTWSGDDWETGDWEQLKRNTFQIVIVREASGSEDLGSDVTIEFNYGTMGDGSDGYGSLVDSLGNEVVWYPDPGDPEREDDFDCDDSREVVLDDSLVGADYTSLEEFNDLLADYDLDLHFDTLDELYAWDRGTLCRWSIGFGDFDPDTEDATGYELFSDTPVADLLDDGLSPLVEGSRNSVVDGRYVFTMIDGELDLEATHLPEDSCARCTGAGKHSGGGSSGGGSSTETPETPTEEPAGAVTAAGGRALLPGTLQPVGPVVRSDGELPSVTPGQVETLIDAVVGGSSISSDGSGTWNTSGDGYSVSIGAGCSSVPAVGADGTISVSGQFAPGTLVDIWLFSTPTFLGSFYVPPDGSFSSSLTLPAGVADGDHTLQINGTSSAGGSVSVNAGLRVNDRVLTLPKTGSGDTLGLVAVWLLAAGIFLVIARRRRLA